MVSQRRPQAVNGTRRGLLEVPGKLSVELKGFRLEAGLVVSRRRPASGNFRRSASPVLAARLGCSFA